MLEHKLLVPCLVSSPLEHLAPHVTVSILGASSRNSSAWCLRAGAWTWNLDLVLWCWGLGPWALAGEPGALDLAPGPGAWTWSFSEMRWLSEPWRLLSKIMVLSKILNISCATPLQRLFCTFINPRVYKQWNFQRACSRSPWVWSLDLEPGLGAWSFSERLGLFEPWRLLSKIMVLSKILNSSCATPLQRLFCTFINPRVYKQWNFQRACPPILELVLGAGSQILWFAIALLGDSLNMRND